MALEYCLDNNMILSEGEEQYCFRLRYQTLSFAQDDALRFLFLRMKSKIHMREIGRLSSDFHSEAVYFATSISFLHERSEMNDT